tara:strand:+ start:1988 stop:2278 length:291 start_codon:yes stop_codon:yes gene_type:complete
MYEGTVQGSRRDQSSILEPKNLNLAIIQAVLIPNNKLKKPTPAIRKRVLTVYLGTTVDNRCSQRPPLSPVESMISAAKGPIKVAASIKVEIDQKLQ